MSRPYSNLDGWKKICPELTIKRFTGVTSTGDIDPAVVAELTAAADGELEPYLSAAGYDVPLATVPDLIRRFSAVISIYNGHVRIVTGEVPKVWRTAYTDVIGTLKDIRDGKMRLPEAPTTFDDFAFGTTISSHFGCGAN